jgi:hypothetical protein
MAANGIGTITLEVQPKTVKHYKGQNSLKSCRWLLR